jgi:hypothetical protein
MLWVPRKGLLRSQSNIDSGANSYGATVTTGASTSTKGSPAQVIASTNFDAYWIRVLAFNVASTGLLSRCCLDICVGASGQERVLIPDLIAGMAGAYGTTGQPGPKVWDFPLYIPAGTRLSAQAACDRTSAAIIVGIYIYGGDGAPAFRVGTKVTTYGIGTVPGAAAFTPGTAAWGAWAQVAATTSEDHFAMSPGWQHGTSAANNRVVGISMGIGPAASEKQAGETYLYTTDQLEAIGGPCNSMPHFQDIPAGTRLAIRGASHLTPDVGFNGAIHCVS